MFIQLIKNNVLIPLFGNIFDSVINITIIDDKKYNMNELLKYHPGGQEMIKKIIGHNGTKIYRNHHDHKFDYLLDKYEIKE
jgi:cytochrome b involved in lipid metabolism